MPKDKLKILKALSTIPKARPAQWPYQAAKVKEIWLPQKKTKPYFETHWCMRPFKNQIGNLQGF